MNAQRTYPDKLEIQTLEPHFAVSVNVPGSKSITNRALVLAALASRSGVGRIHGALRCEDSEVMIESLIRLGFSVKVDWPAENIVVEQNAGQIIPMSNAELFVGNSGTTMRFLAALVATGQGKYRLDGTPRMRERPIEPLLAALRQLGVRAESEFGNGCPPVTIETTGLGGGPVTIRGDISSQFLSALLMIAPFAAQPITITIEGLLVSKPYVEMTVRQMLWHGLNVERRSPTCFFIAPQQPKVEQAMIEADASAASYFFAAAAIAQGTVHVNGYIPDGITTQGDIEFLGMLAQMGCSIQRDLLWNTVHARPLHGIDVDMNAISDTVMTLAAVACFAEGPTTIRNVAHIRHKETDRISALVTELRRIGAEVEEYPDGLKITPRPLRGAEIETYNDHRMAMSMALIGLKVPGIVIKNPGCVAKTYPGFWDDFQLLYK